MSNHGVFSRLTAVNKWPETVEKISEIEVEPAFAKPSASLNFWANEFLDEFIPPPPRPDFLDEELVTADGLTTCDLCSWAYNDKSFNSLEAHAETSNDFMWIVILIIVSFMSALIGAIITTLKYRRSNSTRTFASRSVGMKRQDYSPELSKNQQNDMKRTTIDLKFFNEEGHENDEAFYATLDDQDSLNSENMTTSYPKLTKNDDNDMPMFSSAPSSAYYSDMSNAEKQYETIDNVGACDKFDYRGGGIGSSFITLGSNNVTVTNRLSAISENNFSSHNRDAINNSDYV